MQRFFFFILIIGLVSCNSTVNEPSKPFVAVSIQPQKYLVSSIADTLIDVVVMVPPGASPATWETTTSQMRSLSHARLYFSMGHLGFEKAWMGRIQELNSDLNIIDLSEGLDMISADHQHGDHSHSGVDPHTWMSPPNMEHMARVVYAQLTGLFPEHKEYMRTNYEKLMREIKATGMLVKDQLAAHRGKSFLIFHPSLTYLAKEYGLKQHAIEFEGKEPSAAYMKEITDLAQKEGIRTIFVQQEFDTRNAMIIAGETGAHIVQINPLSEDWAAEMKSIATKLKKSFQ